MKEYINKYSGVKTRDDEQLWSVDLYDGDTIVESITRLPEEGDANAVITTWVVQEGWTSMDKNDETDPVDWDNPLFARDFIRT